MHDDQHFFTLSRPEYVASQDALHAALAWAEKSLDSFESDRHEHERKGAAPGGAAGRTPSDIKKLKWGLAYETNVKRASHKQIEVRVSRTNSSMLRVANLSRLQSVPDRNSAASLLLDELRGARVAKSKSTAAKSLTPELALLQTPRGLTVRPRPPALANILGELYALGSSQGATLPTTNRVAELWWDAQGQSITQKSTVLAQEAAIRLLPVDHKSNHAVRPATPTFDSKAYRVPDWLTAARTPFHWFHESWTRLCSRQWVQAMPRQRWVEWASCVLRAGLGLGFLWECWFYRELGIEVLSSRHPNPAKASDFVCRKAGSRSPPLLPWPLPSNKLSASDVNETMRRVITQGVAVRKFLGGEFGKEKVPGTPKTQPVTLRGGDPAWLGKLALGDWIHAARAAVTAKTYKSELASALESKSKHGHVSETCTYSLLRRGGREGFVDYYGLLRRRSRKFLVFEPGVEWFVVVASLAANGPGATTNLKTVREKLQLLGLEPPREVLIDSLERAGLTRSSPDADQAIEVQSAF
jgi:hypothetical protein